MDIFYHWSPVLVGVGAPLLAWLLVAGHPSLRRTALLVSLASVLVLLIELAAVFVILQALIPSTSGGYQVVFAAYRAGDLLTSLLAVAAWALLLYAAAHASDRTRLVVLTVVLTLALALQTGVTFQTPQPLVMLLTWLSRFGTPGDLIQGVLQHIAAVAAVVCALLAPASD